MKSGNCRNERLKPEAYHRRLRAARGSIEKDATWRANVESLKRPTVLQRPLCSLQYGGRAKPAEREKKTIEQKKSKPDLLDLTLHLLKAADVLPRGPCDGDLPDS